LTVVLIWLTVWGTLTVLRGTASVVRVVRPAA
jgi:hypothetical protein